MNTSRMKEEFVEIALFEKDPQIHGIEKAEINYKGYKRCHMHQDDWEEDNYGDYRNKMVLQFPQCYEKTCICFVGLVAAKNTLIVSEKLYHELRLVDEIKIWPEFYKGNLRVGKKYLLLML